jgi:hypothetical protein
MAGALGAPIPFAGNLSGGFIPVALADEPGPLTIPGKDGPRVMNDWPINAETPPTLLDDNVTPNNGHVSARALTRSLTIDGEGQKPLRLSMADLKIFRALGATGHQVRRQRARGLQSASQGKPVDARRGGLLALSRRTAQECAGCRGC